jgi:phage terminase large subunit-like protein
MAGNARLVKDAVGNWKPSKKKTTKRIDGILAMVMGIGQATTQPRRWSDLSIEQLIGVK